MASYYSTRTAYNSFLVNTVPVSDDYAVSIMQTGTMFLIDASVADSPLTTLDISLPSPDHAGMYYKFVFVAESARVVNIQMQDVSDGIVGLVIQHVDSGNHDVDVAAAGTSDRMQFSIGQKPGSWIELVSTGTQWVVHGHHHGATHLYANDGP